MEALTVRLAAPTVAGRLWPRYDPEVSILAAESRVVRPWPVGVNVDNLVILDLDDSGVVANVDVMVDRSHWMVDDSAIWPSVGPSPADLSVDLLSIGEGFLEQPVVVLTNAATTTIRVQIGERPGELAASLSDDCLALFDGGTLSGFLLRLRP
jgi:hypothetical protein